MLAYCDLDEVIADFTGGALKVHGWTKERLYEERSPGQWSISDVMGLTNDEFWSPIHELGRDFWQSLAPLPWAVRVLDLIAKHEWYIVTSPSRHISSYHGKLWWINEFVGRIDNCFITEHKHLFARKDAVLIDDRERNVEKFVEAGGRGILFPSHGNWLHKYAHDPITILTTALNSKVLRCT